MAPHSALRSAGKITAIAARQLHNCHAPHITLLLDHTLRPRRIHRKVRRYFLDPVLNVDHLCVPPETSRASPERDLAVLWQSLNLRDRGVHATTHTRTYTHAHTHAGAHVRTHTHKCSDTYPHTNTRKQRTPPLPVSHPTLQQPAPPHLILTIPKPTPCPHTYVHPTPPASQTLSG